MCASAPRGLVHANSQPLVCLVLQGTKQVAMGAHSLTYSAGDSLLITADVPTVSQTLSVSSAAPCHSLVWNLNLAIIAAWR